MEQVHHTVLRHAIKVMHVACGFAPAPVVKAASGWQLHLLRQLQLLLLCLTECYKLKGFLTSCTGLPPSIMLTT